MNLAFVDTFSFDPDSDGGAIYSRTAAFDLDLSKHAPGSEWRLKAVTLDHVNHPGDPRITSGMTACLRRLQGRRVLYTIGQYAGGYNIYQLPANAHGSEQGGLLSASGVAVAGDWLFVGMVKPDGGKQYVHILRLSDGSYVGRFQPGDEVGGNAGWQDMPYSVQAMKRRSGEYLVLVEEDWRGKNLLYRWTPEERP